jgi:drug/metabolite transporter (DMT)-like permease
MHIAILLWGFTGILGKAISMGSEHIVWYRMLFSSMSLMLVLLINKQFKLLLWKSLLKISLVGVIVTIHWILFYAAIKVSNVSITLSCFSSITLFTAIMEPIINRKRIDKMELFFALLIMIGIYTIFAFQKIYVLGIALALISAFFGSIFTIYNKRFLEHYDAGVITFYELFTGFIFLSLLLPFFLNYTHLPFEIPHNSNLVYLLLLSIVCTTIAFTISLIALKKLSAFIMNLSVNLEPVYSIVLAIIIFHEDKFLNTGFYIGTAIIIAAVVLHGLHQRSLYLKNKVMAVDEKVNLQL